MDEGNQLLDDAERVSRILEQYKIDEKNMKDLNFANRCYRKCVAGKCPPLHDRHAKTAPTPSIKMRPKTFASKKFQDKVLKQVWKESGRDRRMRILERDLKELDTKIAVASGKTHVTAQENNFKAIVHNIKEIEEINEEIKKEKLQIAHIKSQLERVSQKDDELSRQTESEGKKNLEPLLNYLVTFLNLRSIQESLAQSQPQFGNLRRSRASRSTARMFTDHREPQVAQSHQGHAV